MVKRQSKKLQLKNNNKAGIIVLIFAAAFAIFLTIEFLKSKAMDVMGVPHITGNAITDVGKVNPNYFLGTLILLSISILAIAAINSIFRKNTRKNI